MNTVVAYEDELLSSLFFRISRANFTSLSNILNKLFGIKNLHIKDIDLYNFDKIDMNKFTDTTGIKNIKKHQLLQFEGFLEESININGRKRWVTPLKRIPYKNDFLSTRICPLCLKENAYLKIHWRLMIINICTIHNCYLVNKCPNCNKEIRYPNSKYYQELSDCHYCKYDFRNIAPKYISKYNHRIYIQNKLINIINAGYYKLNNRYYYSIGFFYLLRIIIKSIMRIKQCYKIYIEKLTPHELSYLITYAVMLLNKFPHRLNKFYKKNKLTNLHRILDKYRKKQHLIPNWYLTNINYNKRISNGK